MKLSSVATLTSIVALFVASGTYLATHVVRVDWFQHSITASMTVPESGGLLPRSKVLLSGVEVGRVRHVEHTPDGVRVAFEIGDDFPIPTSSQVRIQSLSGLGEPYLEFRPANGDGPYLEDGSVVAADRIARPMSIPDVARSATTLLEQLDPQAMSDIVNTFTIALAGTDAVMPDIARASNLLASTLLSRTDLIRQMLLDMQAHAPELSTVGAQLTEAAQPWADFGPRVASVADAVSRIIRTGDVPADYLVDTPETVGLVPLLSEITDRINRLGPDLAAFVPILQPVGASAASTLGQLDLSALITQALGTTAPDGAIRLQITPK